MTGNLFLTTLTRVVIFCHLLTKVSGGPISSQLTDLYEKYGRQSTDNWLAVGDESYGPGRYQGWKLMKVSSQSEVRLTQKFDNYANDGVLMVLDEGHGKGEVQVLAAPPVIDEVRERLLREGYHVFTHTEDVEDMITRSFSRFRSSKTVTQNYFELTEVEQFMKDLQKEHPDRVTLSIVGQSYRKRPILQITVKGRQSDEEKSKIEDTPIILIDGGMHAREWISTATCLYVLTQLVEDPSLAQGLEWRVIPVVNPDGYAYTFEKDRFWRKNRRPHLNNTCVGVDLNRNFPIGFGDDGASWNPCAQDYRGTGVNSEPETVALTNAVVSTGDRLKGYLNLHSYGQMILLPWAYNETVKHPNLQNMTRMAEGMAQEIEKVRGTYFFSGLATDALYVASGISADWVASRDVPYSIVIELQDIIEHGFILPESEIEDAVSETWQGIKFMAKTIENEFNLGPEITDEKVVVTTEAYDIQTTMESISDIEIATEGLNSSVEGNSIAEVTLPSIISLFVDEEDLNESMSTFPNVTISSGSEIENNLLITTSEPITGFSFSSDYLISLEDDEIEIRTDNSLMLLQEFVSRINEADNQAPNGNCGADTDCKVSQLIKRLVWINSEPMLEGRVAATENFLINDIDIKGKIQDGSISKSDDLVKYFSNKFL